MFLLVSLPVLSWPVLFGATSEARDWLLAHPQARSVPRPPAFASTGGALLVVDWDNRRVIASRSLPKPMGFARTADGLAVASWDLDAILLLDGAQPPRVLRQAWFNHPHSVHRMADRLLVTSSGTDSILEMDPLGTIAWRYNVFEHDGTPEPLRWFDPALDYQSRYVPSRFGAHPNSAIPYGESGVLATLFSRGELVHVERATGRMEPVVRGLRNPHSIREREGGYVLCDTRAGRLVLLRSDLTLEGFFPVPAGWVQDAGFWGGRVFVAAGGDLSGSGTGACFVRELTPEGRTVCEWSLGDARLYQIEPVPEGFARHLADAWGGAGTSWGAWSDRGTGA